jgi:hypothetical protein
MAAIWAVASAQTTSRDNPTLTERCGLKVMLVLDESNSIYTGETTPAGTDAFTADVRAAATAFVEALEGTGSPLAITAFHSIARGGVPEAETGAGYVEVIPGNITLFTNWINNVSQPAGVRGYRPVTTGERSTTATNPFGTTNWEDSFEQVERTREGPPNLVVFMTDGDPNTVNDATITSGRRYLGNTNAASNQAVVPAVRAAHSLKAKDVRIFGIGVGFIRPGTESETRLKMVTGDTEGINPATSDYILVPSFDELKGEMSHVVASLCGSSLTITKYVTDAHGGPWEKAPDWKFRATLDAEHKWLAPNEGTGHSAELFTNHEGEARFSWLLPADTTSTVTATHETSKEGFHFVEAVCQTHSNGTLEQIPSSTKEIPGATLGREDWHTCEVYNAPEKPGGGGGDTDVPGGNVPEGPRLTITKHMPAHATVGDRVPITIIAKNVGHETADEVRVHETPPDGGRIVAVQDHGSIEHDGTVVWNLGSLAPGESRTVHATMLVTTPGLHLNIAVADANNDYPAFDGVHERASSRRRRPGSRRPAPPVTG